ncbi:MAG TPA: RNA 2',3'-cyclic phosphodiesterase [Myxococcales bacterium]
MRLFFALPLPAEVKERLRPSLEAARRAGGEGVGFTRIGQIHFTLAFLGEQPSAEAALAAGEVLRDNEAFELAIGGAGAFPNTARPRVLWLGVTEGAAQLVVAADRLRRALQANGFSVEERRFRPHLTVGRVRPRGEKWAHLALAAIAPGELARCTVREACLMQSVLGRGGATHTAVETFGFR